MTSEASPDPGQFAPPGPASPEPSQFAPPGPASPQPGQFAPPGPASQYGIPASPQFQQQYGQPVTWPPGAVMPRRTNSLAIAALCCGIGQFVAGPLAGIPAIILGSMSIKQIRETGEDGQGMAVTGLVLGVVGVVLFVLGIILVLAVFDDVVRHLPPSPGSQS